MEHLEKSLMTITQLKQYISENRSNEEKFSAALAELSRRDSNPIIYSQDMPLHEQEKIFMEKIGKH